jgi:hypothetical protein
MTGLNTVFRCSIYPNRTNELSFISLVSRAVNQLNFMEEYRLCMEMPVSQRK